MDRNADMEDDVLRWKGTLPSLKVDGRVGAPGSRNIANTVPLFVRPFNFSGVSVHVPDDYTGKTPLPLVVMLHGYSSDPLLYGKLFGLQDRMDEDKFIQIIPAGRKDKFNHRSWQAWGNHCGECEASSKEHCCGDADVDYLRTLIYAATRNFNVDTKRIYVNGHSDGAAMAYRLACDAADVIAAVMILAGSPPEENWKPGYVCRPSQPISVLHIHGTEDTDVAYDGSKTPPYKGAVGSAELFANLNGCPNSNGSYFSANASRKTKTVANWNLQLLGGKGNDTEVFRVSGCKGGAEVELWKIVGVRHNPRFAKDNYQRHSVAWLLRHHKSAAPTITAPHCVDTPLSWEDSKSHRCQEYAQRNWCKNTGGYGAGWKDSQGLFTDYADEGVSATAACCACGGGLNTSHL